jgi:hypothetical protein
MLATPVTLPPIMPTDKNRYLTHYNVVKEAQDIYKVPSYDFLKVAYTASLTQHIFEVIPKMFTNMVVELKMEMQKNEPFTSESYREARNLYDMAKPFFDKIGKIEIPSNISKDEEIHLYKSVVDFLYTAKDYMTYLEEKFSALDKPKFKSRFFTHIPESELWAIRNKNRPYLI